MKFSQRKRLAFSSRPWPEWNEIAPGIRMRMEVRAASDGTPRLLVENDVAAGAELTVQSVYNAIALTSTAWTEHLARKTH